MSAGSTAGDTDVVSVVVVVDVSVQDREKEISRAGMPGILRDKMMVSSPPSVKEYRVMVLMLALLPATIGDGSVELCALYCTLECRPRTDPSLLNHKAQQDAL
jgi:hypothetical protein